MRRRLLHIAFGISTFVVGSLFALITLSGLESVLPSSDAVAIVDVENEKEVEGESLTFEDFGGIACGFDGKTPASWTSVRASDGVVIRSTLLLFESESAAEKKFKKFASAADRVLESGPYTNYWNVKIGERLLVQKGSEFTLVTYSSFKDSSTTTFNLRVLSAKSLDHLREFDRQGESLRRGFQINRLNP